MLCILFRFFKEFLVTVVEFKKCLIVHTIRSIRHMLVCSQVPIWSTRKKEQTSVDSGTFLIFPFIFLGGAQDDEFWHHPSRNRPSGRPTPATSSNPTILSTNCILSSLCLNLLEGQAGCRVWVLCFPLQRSQHLPPVCWWKYQKVFAFSSSLNASDLSSPWLLRILAYIIWPTTSIKTFPPTSLSARELKYFFPPPFSPLAYRKTGQRWGHMHSLLPAHLRWASQVSTKQLTKQFLTIIHSTRFVVLPRLYDHSLGIGAGRLLFLSLNLLLRLTDQLISISFPSSPLHIPLSSRQALKFVLILFTQKA